MIPKFYKHVHTGSIIKGDVVWVYELRTGPDNGDIPSGRRCSGCAYGYLNGSGNEEYTEPISWGYEGIGSDLAAASMLASIYYPSYGWLESCQKYAPVFAREVIDHLPDSWTMTSEEVLAWLKKKEGEQA